MRTWRSSIPGSPYHPDLNVAGGYNCSTTDRSAWRDRNNHGTHVAGTVGALDNGIGVVGVAPGARVWGVKILNDDGYGLISWYICGLDWILAQRDPTDATPAALRGRQHERHEARLRRPQLRLHQQRSAPPGDLPRRRGRHHRRRRGRQRPPQRQPRTSPPATTRSSPSRPSPTPTARPAASAATAASRGAATTRTTRSPTSATTAPTSTSSRRANASCPRSRARDMRTCPGTSMAAPTVTGAVALYKASRPERDARRGQGGAALPRQPQLEDLDRPRPDPRAAPRRVADPGPSGPSTSRPPPRAARRVEAGTTASIPVTLARSATFFERVRLSITSMPDGWTGAPTAVQPDGLDREHADVCRSQCRRARHWAATRSASRPPTRAAPRRGRSPSTSCVDDPTAAPPVACGRPASRMGPTRLRVGVAWPAGDRSHRARIAGYEVAVQRATAAPGAARSPGPRRSAMRRARRARDEPTRSGCGPVDAAGHWSQWAGTAAYAPVHAVDDRSSVIGRSAGWAPASRLAAYERDRHGSSSAPAPRPPDRSPAAAIAVVAPQEPRIAAARRSTSTASTSGRSSCGRGTSTGRQVVFDRYFPSGGTHTITVRVVGSGTAPGCSGSTPSSSRSSRSGNARPPLARVRYRDRPDVRGPGIPRATG